MKRYLRGYSRWKDTLMGQWEVPSEAMLLVRRLIVGAKDDPDLFDCYPLTPVQVRSLAAEIMVPLEGTELSYFFETEEDWAKVAEMRDAQSAA